MALILHLDTSGAESIVFISNDGQVLASRTHNGARDAGAVINGLIEDVLISAGYHITNLDAMAVCNGPGSYTGLRIALATAKGLCYALDKPLLLYNKLALLLETAKTEMPDSSFYLAILKARTGEYFAASSDYENNILSPQLLPVDDLQSIIQEEKSGTGVVIGEAEEGLHDALKRFKRIDTIQPNETVWAGLAHIDYDLKAWADLALAEPEYLKNVFIHKPKDSTTKT